MKKMIIAVLALIMPVILMTEAEETQDAIEALVGSVDLSEWDEWFQRNGADDGILPSALLKKLAGMQTYFGSEYSGGDLVSKLMPQLGELIAKTALLMGLAAFGAAVNGISESSSAGEAAGAAFRISVSVTVLVLSAVQIRTAFSAIATVEHTAELILPVIVGYLTINGFGSTALLLPASYSLLSGVFLRLIEGCAAPMAIVGGVLLVFDANGAGRLSAGGKLFQRAAKWILGTSCSLYMIITAVRSIAAKNADSLLMKTTKLAAGSVPAIGSLLSESVDTAYQCLFFVKNALGLTGCIVLISVALKPLISVFLTRSSLRASALLSEPLSGKPYAELLRGMGDTLHILMLSELAALAMTLMMLAPVLGTGG